MKLLGGAKKSFSTDKIVLEKNTSTINELISHLMQIKPKDTLEFDTKNLLIAVNGVDSSALQGYDTKLSDNDEISIIPIIHGGSTTRIQFSVMNSNVEIFYIPPGERAVIGNWNNLLRKRFPNLIIQEVDSRFILGVNHVKKILALSLHAKKNKTLLSKKIEIDILLRFAGTTQISRAIRIAGKKALYKNYFIIAIGRKSTLERLHLYLRPYPTNPFKTKQFSKNNHQYLKKQFKISSKQISAVSSKNPLEDIIVEKATVLI